MQSRNQYLKVLRERYLKAKAKEEKTQILDEYCRSCIIAWSDSISTFTL